MAQVLEKPFDCLGCGKAIRLSKIDNVPFGQKKHWEKYEMDGKTIHKCPPKNKQPQPPTTTTQREAQPQQPQPQKISTVEETVAFLAEEVRNQGEILAAINQLLKDFLAVQSQQQATAATADASTIAAAIKAGGQKRK